MDNNRSVATPESMPAPGAAEAWNLDVEARAEQQFEGTTNRVFSNTAPQEIPHEATSETTATPAFEIITTEEQAERPAVPLAFNPDAIHPNRYDISNETVQAVRDTIRGADSPNALMDNFQAMRDAYNAADAKIEGYDAYLGKWRGK